MAIIINIDVMMAKRKISLGELAERVDAEVMLRADQSVAYGRVAELIGQLQQAGLNRIAFVTERAAAGSVR